MKPKKFSAELTLHQLHCFFSRDLIRTHNIFHKIHVLEKDTLNWNFFLYTLLDTDLFLF